MHNWKRVGQRVKKVRDNGGIVPVGSEGVITGLVSMVMGSRYACPNCTASAPFLAVWIADFHIKYDGIPCDEYTGHSCGCWSDVEPIIPDSYKVVEWSEVLWNPSHLTDALPAATSSESINA